MGASGNYELSEKADVYTQLMFTDYRSIAQIAPGGIFIGDTSTINCDNPFIPTNRLGAIGCTPALIASGGSVPMYIGRRNTEGGGRQQDFRNQSFRAVIGVRGDMAEGWDYDFYIQRSGVKADQLTLNYFVINRITEALDAVRLPNGTIQCRSSAARADGCVPYNPFANGGVTPEALEYLQAPGLQQGTIDQEIYNLTLTGDLGTYGIKLPTATDPVQIAVGAEYRRDTLKNDTDALLATAGLSGTGGATIGIEGATTVRDYFMDARVPLVQGAAFADDLSFDTAYRYSDYGDSNTNTYKFGLAWAPVEDIKLRGSYQKAVRAANIVELFTAQGFNLFDIGGDPCGPSRGTANVPGNASVAECIATGVPAAFVGSAALDSPAGQYQFTQGGNPALAPEESETITAGIILTPRFLPGFVASFDYFDITVDELISTYGAENTLVACYDNNDAAACARIVRNSLGQLWLGSGNVLDTNINIGSLETSGVDVNLSYSGLELGAAGSLTFSLQGTYIMDLITDPGPGIEPYDCVGFFVGACGTPNPEWRHQFRISYLTPIDLDVALTWRYYDGVDAFRTSPNNIDSSFASQSYIDLAGTYSFTDKVGLTVGVNNVFDRDPPLNSGVGTTGNGNTYPQTYDALGRYIFMRARVGF
jgi:outer membrane receptor protein involved in Fe transport